MYCMNCGAELDSGALFCAKCGSKVDPKTTKSTETEQQEPAATLNTTKVADTVRETGEKSPEHTSAAAAETEKPNQEKKPQKFWKLPLFTKIKKTTYDAASDAAAPEDGAPQAKNLWHRLSKRTKKIVIIGGGSFLLLCIALVITLVLIDCAERYENAVALMNDGEYAQALEEFENLHRYKDAEIYAPQCQYAMAEEMMADSDYDDAKQEFLDLADYEDADNRAQECQNYMDYIDAEEMLADGSYLDAKQAFIALDDFTDAYARAEECQNNIDYLDAVAMMDDLYNAEALAVFTRLGDFKDSTANAVECQNRIDYDTATDKMDTGDYEGALKILSTLAGFSDAQQLAQDCQNIIDYSNAELALADGKNYTAYVLFDGLGSYSDAAERAEECILETPESEEIYHNDDYSKRISITFHAPKGDEVNYYTLIKVYAENGDLVSMVFLRPNEKVKIRLPSGKYMMKEAIGLDWFGQQEMFGDNAYYSVMVFEDGEYTQIKSSYYYTIKCDVEDGNVGGREEDREDF